MSKKKSLFLSLALVLIFGLSIVAGTFAYFQWQAATGTQVNVTIEMGGITMNIEPEATEFVGLYPTAHCINNVRYGDALVTIENKTGALAIPSFKLKVAVNPSTPDTGKLNDYKDNIHYAVVALETNKDGSKKLSNGNVITVGGNTIDELVTGTCSAPLNVSNTGDNDNTFKTDYGKTATGLFDVITAENTFADTAFLPREYNSTTGKVQGVTFRGEAYSTSYQWYRVYVWIDEGYTTTIIGNDVTDPLQNAQIQVTWSENSMLQQVSGESIVEEVLVPGYYENEVMVYTWDELLANGDIGSDDEGIYSSNKTLSGTLVISEEVNKIYEWAFKESKLTSVLFASGSKLQSIGFQSFYGSNLREIEIPASVTEIEEHAFATSSLSSVTFAYGTQLQLIKDSAFKNTNISTIEIPASVTTIGLSAFADCDNLVEMKYKGTVAQWNAITKGDDWNKNLATIWIECLDGVLTIKEPGLYSSYGYYTSWADLINGGNITVVNNEITASNYNLSGSLVIPEGITSIGEQAFFDQEYAYSLTLDTIYVPSTVVSIGDFAFESIILEKLLFAPNSQLKTIGNSAFYNININKIDLPATVVSIGDLAFEGAGIESLTFAPNSQLKTIGNSAFYAGSLGKIEIPASVTSIGQESLADNNNLDIIIFKGTVAQWNAITKGDDWNRAVPAIEIICSNGVVTLREPGLYDLNNNMVYTWDDLVSSNQIILNGTIITKVNSNFNGHIVVSSEITEISESAFSNNGISKISFSANSHLVLIERFAFEYSSLYEIIIPTFATIKEFAFDGTSISIYYLGTVAQWNALDKDEGWNSGSYISTIICSDGEIQL